MNRSGCIRTVPVAHDRNCPCLFRLVQVAGEFTVNDQPRRKHSLLAPPLPFTGFEMRALLPPSKIIVSELLLTGVLPGIDSDVLLLEPEENGQDEISLTDQDVEEVADLLPSPFAYQPG